MVYGTLLKGQPELASLRRGTVVVVHHTDEAYVAFAPLVNC
jgi:hypothetical protein